MKQLTSDDIKGRILRINGDYAFPLHRGEAVDMRLLDMTFNLILAEETIRNVRAKDQIVRSDSSGGFPYFPLPRKLHLVFEEELEELHAFLKEQGQMHETER